MKQKLQKFMIGRYGLDQFSQTLMIISIIFLVISMFSKKGPFYLIALLILGYTYFRMFSKNISKRYEENQKFLNFRYRFVAKTDQLKKRWTQRNIYRFFSCPSCKQKVRVPKGKGKICITCPKCKTEFIKKS